MSVAKMLLKERPRLQLLSLVQDKASTRARGLPSWVPDWTSQLTGEPLVLLRGDDDAFGCDPNGDKEAGQLFHMSGDDLALQGAQFDSIIATSSPMWEVLKTQNIEDILALCRDLNPRYLESHIDPGGSALAHDDCQHMGQSPGTPNHGQVI